MINPLPPAGWRNVRLRFVLEFPTKREVARLPESTLVSFVPMEAIGEWGGLRLDSTKELGEVQNGYSYFRDGDVVVAKITPCFENGKGALAEGLYSGIGFGTTELHSLRPRPGIHGRYLFYLTCTHQFRRMGEGWMYGAGGQKRVPERFIKDLVHPIPPCNDQGAIADFLDRETARIDELIAKKERVIELLKEKHRALITRVVMYGVDPSAEYRDSGLAWMGPIPVTWKIIKLKHIAQINYGVGEELDKSLVSGVPLISLPNIDLDGRLSLAELGWAKLDDIQKPALLLKKGDLLFNWRNGSSQHLGKTAYFDANGEFTHVGFLLRIRFDQSCFEPRFYRAFINALRATGFFLYSRAMVNNTFNQTELENLHVVVPNLGEQRAIVTRIESETARGDGTREAAERTIRLLAEYRTALISAAVTGQIDVRTYRKEPEAIVEESA